MSLNSHNIFNPHHSSDIQTAFTRFIRKFGYIYEGENRSVPASVNTDALITEWKEKVEARLFLSCAVSDEFFDDYEAASTIAVRNNIAFNDLVKTMTDRYAPTSNKVRNHN